MDHCPSELFIHVSPTKCWEMVRDRVNQEITKQHRIGKANLPPLQPPGSLDGFEMFGFSSPAIVQVELSSEYSEISLLFFGIGRCFSFWLRTFFCSYLFMLCLQN